MDDKAALKQLIRYEITPLVFMEKYYNDEFDADYKPTSDDLLVACRNMIDKQIDWDIFYDWFMYILEDLTEYYEGVWDSFDNDDCLWTGDDNDLFCLLVQVFDTVLTREDFTDQFASFAEFAEGVLKTQEDYDYNREHEVKDWKIGKIQRFLLLENYEDHEEDIPDKYIDLFRTIVDEECERGAYSAMRIKGYSCYGGNRLYECDWEESRNMISALFEKYDDPIFANTLGYIHYYGRCNNGVPEYEKAFQYYSIGVAHGLLESTYKQADMFMKGKGCIKSESAANAIYERLYQECRPRFCCGDDAKFADIALRQASIYQRKEFYSFAYATYLEADYAIKKRMKKSDFFGNTKVQESITQGLKETREKLKGEFFVDKLIQTHPFILFNVTEDGRVFKVSIDTLDSNHYKIKLKIEDDNGHGKVFVVIPELNYVDLTKTIEFEIETDKAIEYSCEDKEDLYIDGFRSETDGYSFTLGDEEVFAVHDVKFIFRK